MEILAVIGIVLIGGALLARSITTVPQAKFGIVDWAGRRSKGYRTEGMQVVLPFSDVTTYSFKLEPRPVKVSVFVRRPDTQAKIEVVLKGLMDWRPDPDIQYSLDRRGKRRILDTERDGEGLVLFVEMTPETVVSGVEAAIKSNVGTVAGRRTSDEFVDAKEVIELMINAILRLGWNELPHFPHRGQPDQNGRDARCNLYQCPDPCEFVARIDDPFAVYAARMERIREILHGEQDTPSRSEVELRYGIDIVNFSLDPVDFSEAAKKAFEEIIKAESDASSAEARADKTLDLMSRFKRRKLDPQGALNAAQVAVGQGTRQVHSIEGVKPLVEIKDVHIRGGGD